MMSRITLDMNLIDALKSDKGGWTREALKAVGVEWPLREGWIDRLIGKTVDSSVYVRALSARNDRAPQNRWNNR